ncbi:MAG: aldo/keto reductase [Theionarchaea archaeon]|nr:aldo/keto reductase [Theionarchaea archaeon]MBU7038103.1 aldo/keto reductase [Theionarchaea archaeon]
MSPLGIGTWSWGDHMIWGYGQSYTRQDLETAFRVCVEKGITFFDTAEAYGWGQAERLLGQFAHTCPEPLVIGTKFLPSPWRLRRSSLLAALENSLNRLDMERVDLYQFHKHFPPVSFEAWMDSLIEALEMGKARAVGISNCGQHQMLQAADLFSERGMSLSSNQVEFSLLSREPEYTELLNVARRQGITLIAYSPLAMGVLTGKYTAENPPVHKFSLRERLALYAYSLAMPSCSAAKACQYGPHEIIQIQHLVDVLRDIAAAHHKTPAQVALNWVICKGAVPIVGVKNEKQALENAGALGWSLTRTDVAELDEVSSRMQQVSNSA